MGEVKIQTKLTELWDELGALSRDDTLFRKKQMYLYAQIVVYTIILATVHRIKGQKVARSQS